MLCPKNNLWVRKKFWINKYFSEKFRTKNLRSKNILSPKKIKVKKVSFKKKCGPKSSYFKTFSGPKNIWIKRSLIEKKMCCTKIQLPRKLGSKILVKILAVIADILMILTNVTRTYMLLEQISPLKLASVKDCPRNRTFHVW